MNRWNVLHRSWSRVHFLCVAAFVYAFSILLKTRSSQTTIITEEVKDVKNRHGGTFSDIYSSEQVSEMNITFAAPSSVNDEQVFLEDTNNTRNDHVTKIGPLHRPSEAVLFRPKQYSIWHPTQQEVKG